MMDAKQLTQALAELSDVECGRSSACKRFRFAPPAALRCATLRSATQHAAMAAFAKTWRRDSSKLGGSLSGQSGNRLLGLSLTGFGPDSPRGDVLVPLAHKLS